MSFITGFQGLKTRTRTRYVVFEAGSAVRSMKCKDCVFLTFRVTDDLNLPCRVE